MYSNTYPWNQRIAIKILVGIKIPQLSLIFFYDFPQNFHKLNSQEDWTSINFSDHAFFQSWINKIVVFVFVFVFLNEAERTSCKVDNYNKI